MDQFVVLHHKMPKEDLRDDHWDLMLQHDDVLWTWALEKSPAPGIVCDGRKLTDHHIKYLTYEGPVSRGRGQVTRLIAGEFNWLAEGIAELFYDGRVVKMTVSSLSQEICKFEFS